MVRNGEVFGPYKRKLNEFDVFIRDNRAVGILNKAQSRHEKSFSDMVSARDPFGPALSSNFTDYHMEPMRGDLRLHLNITAVRLNAE